VNDRLALAGAGRTLTAAVHWTMADIIEMPFPFVDSASYPVRRTDALKLYVDGEEAFAAIADAIEGAKSYVYITVATVQKKATHSECVAGTG